MDKFIEDSKHHIILAKGVENNLTKEFDNIAETDKDFKKIWDHDKNSSNFFMHVNATSELSEEDAKQLAGIMKDLYARAKEENHQKREARKKAKREALINAEKTDTSAN